MKKIYITKNQKETIKLGEKLAKRILEERKNKTAIVLALEGEIGAGKTTFLKGFAKGLKIKEKILSPTFLIIRRIPLKISKYRNFYHIDCYRIKKKDEVLSLDFKGIIKDAQNIVAIEWPQKIKKFLPKKALRISFKIFKKNKRRIIIKNL